MNAKLCDACKKVISEKEIYRAPCYFRYFELCEECKEKFNYIKVAYEKSEQKLEEKHKALQEKFKNELKEMGIDYE